MKTIKLLALLAWAAVVANCLSCVPVAFPVGSPNPLETPGELEPTTETLHLKNIRAITNNPVYQQRDFMLF